MSEIIVDSKAWTGETKRTPKQVSSPRDKGDCIFWPWRRDGSINPIGFILFFG